MSALDLIKLIDGAAFFLIATLTIIDFVRYRTRARLDIALMISSLALPIVANEIQELLGVESRWIRTLGAVAVVAHPFLLLRLVRQFRRVPRMVAGAAVAGMVVSWVAVVAVPTPLPTALTLLIVAYFAFIEIYAVAAFVRASWTRPGVMHWRLLFAASGSGWLALAVLLAGVNRAWPAAAVVITPLTPFLTMLSAVSYFVGFAPPRALRRAWQLAELYRFIRESAGHPASERLSDTLKHLCPAATRAVGGLASTVWLRDEPKGQWTLSASDRPDPPLTTISEEEGPIGQVWQEQRPIFVLTPEGMGQEGALFAAAFDASAQFIVPIATQEKAWGVLAVFVGHSPLFPDDDLEALSLFAEQTAAALESADLIRQQREVLQQLEAANKELEAFSYSVSHDLRAPLRAMDGFSRELLERDSAPMDDEARHYLERVRNNAQRMGQLVDDLLAFSRMGRQPLKLQRVLPAEVVRAVWEELNIQREGRRVEIHLDELPPCQADPAMLKQVFANLLDNALKYTRRREQASITVGCLNNNHQPTYFVKDNGVGFDMIYAHKLFGVFQRLHPAEEFEGTGVGLAIVQRIIHRHGGEVRAEAALEEGATFYFTLRGVA